MGLLVLIEDVESFDGAHGYASVTWKPCARRVVVGLELVGRVLAGSCEGDDARRQGCPALACCRVVSKLLTCSNLDFDTGRQSEVCRSLGALQICRRKPRREQRRSKTERSSRTARRVE